MQMKCWIEYFSAAEIKRTSPRIESATVTNVNSDGTVDVILPREPETEFTRIQNQTPFELREGDSVEIMLKKGSFNNCWVMAKHGTTKRFGVDDNGLTD